MGWWKRGLRKGKKKMWGETEGEEWEERQNKALRKRVVWESEQREGMGLYVWSKRRE